MGETVEWSMQRQGNPAKISGNSDCLGL